MNQILDEKEQIGKSPILKFKHAIIIFVIGWIVGLIGDFLKLESLPYGSITILISYLIKTIGLILIIIKLLTIKDKKSIFNK